MCLAIPARVVELVEDDSGEAVAEVGGVRRRVNIDLVREQGLNPGDWVLIHVGFALSKVGEREAREQLRLLELLGEPDEARRPVADPGAAGGPSP